MNAYEFEERGGGFKNYVRIAHRLYSPEDFAEAGKRLEAAKVAVSGDPKALQRVIYLEKGLKDAELTVATRAAQALMEKNPTERNKAVFRQALGRLYEYRASIEGDNVANFGYFAERERSGSGWDINKP